MLEKWGIAVIALMLSASPPAAPRPAHQVSAASVVKITCKLPGGEANATGFVWSESRYVVTALHAVAGCSSIVVYSEHKEDEGTAKVVAVNREADLAQLELLEDRPLLTPLQHATTAPDMDAVYHIWGYPHDIPSMNELKIQLSRGLLDKTTLGKAFFKTRNDFKKQVGSQGYPGYGAKIFRVGSTIQPGHSGAPILNKAGQVVAIADGGLKKGTAGINWSIPAMEYLPGLARSGDKIPTKPSKQTNLMSSYAATGSETVNFQRNDGEQGTLNYVLSIPITELRDFIPDEGLEDFDEIMGEMAEQGQNIDVALKDLYIDVYEDYDTGASIAVPARLGLEWDDEYEVLIAANEPGNIAMLIKVMHTDSFATALKTAENYLDLMDELGDWEVSEDYESSRELLEEEERLWLDMGLVELDDNKEPLGGASIRVQVNGGDVLGITSYVRIVDAELSADDWLNLHLLDLCESYLTQFAQY